MTGANAVLFIDAYDSFSHNIIAFLEQQIDSNVSLIHIDTDVRQKFGVDIGSYLSQFSAIVIGPGPGNPNELDDIGILYDVVDAATSQQIPVLGICLGFQVLCVKHGLPIIPMKEPCHGQPKKIFYYAEDRDTNKEKDVFANIDTDDVWATCYNSLGLMLQDALREQSPSRPETPGSDSGVSATSSGSDLSPSAPMRVLAVDHEANVMAIRHRYLPFWGFQFHPESCKSNDTCRQLVGNWWRAVQQSRGSSTSYLHEAPVTKYQRHTNERPTILRGPALHGDVGLPDRSRGHTEAMVARLLEMSTTSGNHVHWHKVHQVHGRSQLSELIHDLSGEHNVAMLESTRKGRFSIYAVLAGDFFVSTDDPHSTAFYPWHIEYHNSSLRLHSSERRSPLCMAANRNDFWDALQCFMTRKRAMGGPPEIPFWGGFIGYLSYEHGLKSLGIKSSEVTNPECPEISLLWTERSIVHDNLTNAVYVQSIRHDDHDFINGMVALLSASSQPWSRSSTLPSRQQRELQRVLDTAQISLPDYGRYSAQFSECQSELRAGNSYELCLTTETTVALTRADTKVDYEFQLYKNLHTHNPVPFGAFLRLRNTTILSTSPEQYMSWSRDGIIDMIPMKGTVKRSSDMTLDKASSILSSAKESAENLMIADLIRHDLYNSLGHQSQVEVIKLCEVIEHETVYQLVSHIRGHAPVTDRTNVDERQCAAIHYGLNSLRQTAPPGSMTGAPKKRSCEILARLEQRDRGIYSGVLGYIDVGGGGNWNVCIRSAFRHHSESVVHHDRNEVQDVWHLGAGGAVTVLSDVDGEWQEMMVKLESVLKGFQVIRAGDAI